jgi:uncharacterized low-complexity protein
MHLRQLTSSLLAATFVCLTALTLWAQADDNAKPAAAAKPAVKNQLNLNDKQGALAARYQRFEKTLLQMAEYMRKTDPERADLLIRAIAKSKSTRITQQMQQIAKLLDGQSAQYGEAIGRQQDVVLHLQSLLKLLQSENAREKNLKEQARIKDLIKDLTKVIGKEKDVRAGTERREDAGDLERKQKKVAEEARRLANKIDGQDAARNGEPGEGKPGEGKPGEGKPGEGKPGEGKPGEGKPGEEKPGEAKPGEEKPGEEKPGEEKPGEEKPGEGKPGEGKPGEGKPGEGKPGEGKPGEGKPGEGKPGEGKPGEGKPGESGSEDQQKTAGRDEIEKAIEKMERAIEELKKKNFKNAAGEEDAAIAELEKAKAKLEEILRQLREEERELLLAALEARFQKMLIMQKIVLAGTKGLGRTPQKDWQPRHEGRSREMAVQEDDIALEAAKALTLLKEEGSSVAFPEAVDQLRDDMLIVSRRLREFQVGELTQGIEKDVIEALEELIEALQKEMEKSKEQPPGEPPPPGEPQDPPLVDKLAELKMLRSLQLRINRRTRRLGRLIDGDQATEDEVIQQLKTLAKRQQRIQEATYDLATGKNK